MLTDQLTIINRQSADNAALVKAIGLSGQPPALYRIHYQLGSKAGAFPGLYTEADADLWLKHLEREAGVRYWKVMVGE